MNTELGKILKETVIVHTGNYGKPGKSSVMAAGAPAEISICKLLNSSQK
jgi:hypothetical protein